MTETVEIFLLAACVILSAANLAVSLSRRRETPRSGADTADDGKEPEEKPGKMDEGFENIMTFSVRGKTGFEMGDE